MLRDGDPNDAPLRTASDIFPITATSVDEPEKRPKRRIGLDLAFALTLGLALLFDLPVRLLNALSSTSPRVQAPVQAQVRSGLKCRNFRIMTGVARECLAVTRALGLSLRQLPKSQGSANARLDPSQREALIKKFEALAAAQRDPWEKALKIRDCPQFQDVCVVSAGPDGEFSSSDDVVLPISGL